MRYRNPALVLTSKPIAVLAIAMLVLTMLTSCSHKKKATSKSSSTSSSASTTPTTTAPATPKPRPVNPLTGIGAPPTTPVIAVKVDDTPPGRPQVGIDKADVVYIEEAEGGLTRLAAVFGTNKPVVGYVRSTRPSDPDLLLQYGKITEAASGGGHDALPLLDKSGIKGWIMDRGAAYYSRVSRYQSDYINVVLDLSKVAKKAKTPAPRSIGWTWNASTAALPKTSGRRIITKVGSQTVEFRYNPAMKKYIRYIDGVAQKAADGKYVATSNVIVQSCKVVPHPQDTDVNGNPSQFTYTTGKNKVVVFRDGRRIDGTWSRPTLNSGTTLTDASGKAIALAPGGAWVALARIGTKVSSS
ncbi:MAG: DUF3048 domain-containing protein [Jatrophihabitans sp.]